MSIVQVAFVNPLINELCMYVCMYVRGQGSSLQPTLDPSAETVNRPNALAQGREEGNWLVCA